MLNLLCPRIEWSHTALLSGILSDRRAYVASPKAIAAQTFTSADFRLPYHESKIWELIAYQFEPQIACDPVSIEISAEAHPWIAFPWALATISVEAVTAVWLEAGASRRVRHVRLFASEAAAIEANSHLLRDFQSSSSDPVSPLPSQLGQQS